MTPALSLRSRRAARTAGIEMSASVSSMGLCCDAIMEVAAGSGSISDPASAAAA